jgi:hypothetical protein
MGCFTVRIYNQSKAAQIKSTFLIGCSIPAVSQIQLAFVIAAIHCGSASCMVGRPVPVFSFFAMSAQQQQQHFAMTGTYMPTDMELRAMAAVQPLPPPVNTTLGMDMGAADMMEDVKLGPEPASPAFSSASSKEKWQQKRHMCDRPDCGKSFDSKWALIRSEQSPRAT